MTYLLLRTRQSRSRSEGPSARNFKPLNIRIQSAFLETTSPYYSAVGGPTPQLLNTFKLSSWRFRTTTFKRLSPGPSSTSTNYKLPPFPAGKRYFHRKIALYSTIIQVLVPVAFVQNKEGGLGGAGRGPGRFYCEPFLLWFRWISYHAVVNVSYRWYSTGWWGGLPCSILEKRCLNRALEASMHKKTAVKISRARGWPECTFD